MEKRFCDICEREVIYDYMLKEKEKPGDNAQRSLRLELDCEEWKSYEFCKEHYDDLIQKIQKLLPEGSKE